MAGSLARGKPRVRVAFSMLTLVAALFGLMHGAAAAQSNPARWVIESGYFSCGWENQPAYATVDLSDDIAADIFHYSDCYDACDGRGCISHIIVADLVYEIRGSEPFRLNGSSLGRFSFDGFRQDTPVDTAIGRIKLGRLLTGYWNDDAGRMIITGATEVTANCW